MQKPLLFLVAIGFILGVASTTVHKADPYTLKSELTAHHSEINEHSLGMIAGFKQSGSQAGKTVSGHSSAVGDIEKF